MADPPLAANDDEHAGEQTGRQEQDAAAEAGTPEVRGFEVPDEKVERGGGGEGLVVGAVVGRFMGGFAAGIVGVAPELVLDELGESGWGERRSDLCQELEFGRERAAGEDAAICKRAADDVQIVRCAVIGKGGNGTIQRPSGISSSAGFSVDYSYLGMGMFAVTDYGADVQLDRTLSADGKRNSVGHTDQDPGIYPGFDRFGRVQFHAWVDGDLTEHATPGGPDRPFLFAEGYGYDQASNRRHKDTVQPVVGQNWNHVDWEYTYDGLDRLIEARRGVWSGSALTSTAGNSQKWTLDMLGNWSEFMQNLNGDGTAGVPDYTDADELETRAHNAANELDRRDPAGGDPPASPGLPFGYDKAGNITSQKLRTIGTTPPAPENSGTGTRAYIHDAWNRLVEVQLDHDDAGGSDPFVVARYEYNPLHWRTVKVADVRAPGSNPTTEPPVLQRRAMFYDASWRMLEEHICDDWDVIEGGEVNRIGQYFWGLRYIDDFIYRQEDRDLTNSDPELDPEEPDFDVAETGAWYALTDVQFSVVALITPEAKLVERVVYDPYGRGRHHFGIAYDGSGDPVGVGPFVAFATAHGGGQLQADWNRNGTVGDDYADFFNDWLDVYLKSAGGPGQISWRYSPSDSTTDFAPDNVIGYCGYVFNPETDDYTVRFRHYDPEIGRWLKGDPAGYVDGCNLAEYVASTPFVATDPDGLKLKVLGSERHKNLVEGAFNKLCPGTVVKPSGRVDIPDPVALTEEDIKNGCDPKCFNPPGCDLLRALQSHKDDVIIKEGPRHTMQWIWEKGHPRVWVTAIWNPEAKTTISYRYKGDGKKYADRMTDPWEGLWHEMIHAHRAIQGDHPGGTRGVDDDDLTDYQEAEEEIRTIDRMNALRKWYHDCATSKKANHPVWPPLRDPFGHPEVDDVWPSIQRDFPEIDRGPSPDREPPKKTK